MSNFYEAWQNRSVYKKQLLEKHAADTLSEEEKEELGRHLITAKLELENEGVVQRLLR